MKDDVAAPNLGQANKEFDAQYFWTTYRTIEQWMQQTTSKGNVSVAALTADTLEVEDIVVSGDASVEGDLTVTGTVTGDLTGDVTGNVTGNLTGDVTATDVTVGDDLTVGGDTALGGYLTISKADDPWIALRGTHATYNWCSVNFEPYNAAYPSWDIGADNTGFYIDYYASSSVSSSPLFIEPSGNIAVTGHLRPTVTATQNLGSSSLRWGTVYTSDLSLKNDVGDWTIVEGADDLFITNNRNGKRYKFALTEVDNVD